MDIITFDLTTDADGDATATYGLGAPALLYAVEWIVGTLATGVDAVLSSTGNPGGVDHALLTLTDANANALYYPRAAEHDNTGAVQDPPTRTLPIVAGDLKVVISDGGNAKAGKLLVYLK